jgi:environmental stress-induced protein Ves
MGTKACQIIRKEEGRENQWAGGTTWELFRYPEDSSYETRDFLFRLSRAEIREESVAFTLFPDYQRHLMILSGEIVLVHEGKNTLRLSPFEQEVFDGGQPTRSFGRAQDYNLMVRKGQVGQLRALTLGEEAASYPLPSSFFKETRPYLVRCYYCESGYSVVVLGEDTMMLRPGDQLVLHGKTGEEMNLKLMGQGRTIEALVAYGALEGLDEESSVGFKERPTWQDIKDAFFIAYTNFRGAAYFSKRRRTLWYDPLLAKGILRVERFYLPMVIFVLGFLFSVYAGMEVSGNQGVAYWVLAWLLLDLFVITPGIYLWGLPLPLRNHMKPLKDLTPYEKALYQKELSQNPQLEKILKRYAITGRNVGDQHEGRAYGSFRDDDKK